RAAQTLAAHYHKAIGEQPEETLVPEIEQLVLNAHAASVLRMELARLLRDHGKGCERVWETLLDPAHPAPLRLMAADLLLADSSHSRAQYTLSEIARLPNREIALATAEVVQHRLGIDLGLPIGQDLPAAHSRQAAEVTRRVMLWAEQQNSTIT